MLGSETQVFELAGEALAVERDGSLLVVCATALASGTLAQFVGHALGEVGELVGAQQLLATLSHLVHACGGGGVDGGGDVAGVEFGLKSALVFHVEEEFPRLLCQRCGEHLHIVGATCGVDHLVEMAFLLEQDLLVACDALAEVVARLVGSVERGDDDGVDASQCGTHGLGLRAEQVHVTVINRLVEARGLGVDLHLASASALGLVLVDDLCPQLTTCAELGDFHKVDVRHTHVELDAVCYLVGGKSSIGHLGHPLIAPSQCVAQFLIDVSASVVEQQ